MHGSQDLYESFRGACIAFMPDGKVRDLPTEQSVIEFYREIRRATIGESYRWNCFICHVIEDQEEKRGVNGFVPLLKNGLRAAGVGVRDRDFTLKRGDRLSSVIEWGLRSFPTPVVYAVVVLSPSFFAHGWLRELDGLAKKEMILPVVHNATADYVRKKSPQLADKLVTQSSDINRIVDALQKIIKS